MAALFCFYHPRCLCEKNMKTPLNKYPMNFYFPYTYIQHKPNFSHKMLADKSTKNASNKAHIGVHSDTSNKIIWISSAIIFVNHVDQSV